MCILASKALEVSQGSVDYKVRREIYDLSAINSLIQSRSVTGGTSVIFIMNQNTLSDNEFSIYRVNVIARLKEAGYSLKRVKHPDTSKFLLDISWANNDALPAGI